MRPLHQIKYIYKPKITRQFLARLTIGSKYIPNNKTGAANTNTKIVLPNDGIIDGVVSVALVRYMCFKTLM